MNTGAIAVRYATALLKAVQESGRGEQVFSQVRRMLASPDTVPQPLEPDLERLTALLVRNGRVEYVKFIFSSFVRMYCRSVGVRLAHLVSASPVEGLEERVRSMLERHTGDRVIIDSKVDPNIVGGFILEVDDYILDASVARQIELIRRKLVVQNKRLI